MKRSSVYFVILALVWALTLSAPRAAQALCVEKGQVAPDFTLQSIDGKTVSLSAQRGKVVLMAFWASWCSRCLEELTFLQELNADLSDDIVVLAINQETQNLSATHVAQLKQSVAELGVEFPIVLDKNLDVWSAYCINALPTSVILDREGVVRFAEPNYYWASKKKITKVLLEMGVLAESSAMLQALE